MTQYFVAILQQEKLRVEILMTQKSLVESLKRCELFKDARNRKLEEISGLKQTLNECVVLCDKFREQMPKVKVKQQEAEIKRAKTPVSLYDYSKHLQELEKSIGDIEKKLKEIN